MAKEQIIESIIDVIRDTIDTDELISAEDTFQDDLEMESMDIFSMLSDLESEFGVHIPERKLQEIFTIDDLAELIQAKMNEKK